MTDIIDLSRVRAGRAELARLARTYPELRGERSASNAERWIETLESIGDEKVDIAKTCLFCGKGFIATRKDALYCSVAHRVAANRRKDERGPSELAALLMKAAQAHALYLSSVGFPDAAKHKRATVAALHVARAAIEAELGIVHAAKDEPTDEPSPEPEQLVLTISSTPDQVREKLRGFMAEHNIGQTRIAELCGVSQSQISRFLRLSNPIELTQDARNAIEKMIDERNN
jgi:Hepatocyte nuclear factor 1 (HNF-1), N terminus